VSKALLAGSIALLLAILGIAVQATRADPGPGGRAAALVPASALAFARLDTDAGDPAARRLERLAPRIPGYRGARDAALRAISPAPGGFDLERDVRPWLGDEAAVALVDLGGGRFGSLVVASVRNEPKAEALLQRVAGARPAARYDSTVVRRFGGGNAAAFVRGFLVAGPELAVQRSIDVARGDAPSLGEASAFTRALAGARRPAEVFVSKRGLGAAPEGMARTLAALLEQPRQQALGVAAGADARGLRLRVRSVGTGHARPNANALVARVPAGAIAVLAAPDAGAAVAAAEKVGAAATLDSVRTVLTTQASLDTDRDLLGRLKDFAAWVSNGAGAPVIGLAAHTDDPKGLREVLARLQDPVARALAEDPESPAAFDSKEVAGVDAFSLHVSPGFQPTYAVSGDTVVVATQPQAVGEFLTRGGARLTATRAFRSALTAVPPKTESLGFFDVRQLLTLGEQTGLTAEDLRPVRAASAVIQREEDDTTAELFFEIP
jgi:Protein of unknown function (DUF3352)